MSEQNIDYIIRRDICDVVAENILMWKLIDEAFDKFSNDIGRADKKIVMYYVMQESKGSLFPFKVQKALEELV